MKKILSIALFTLLIQSSVTYAQSNLTWTIKDHMDKGAIKTMTVFNSNFTGFKSNEEVTKFCQNLKANPDVASCDVLGSTATSCNIKLTMKRPQTKPYYLAMASRSGVTYISINGSKKSIDEMKRGKK